MSEAVAPDVKQARMTEFMKLLPLTIELAGLPKVAATTLFTADQIEARIMSIRTAYKLGRAMLKDIGENGV